MGGGGAPKVGCWLVGKEGWERNAQNLADWWGKWGGQQGSSVRGGVWRGCIMGETCCEAQFAGLCLSKGVGGLGILGGEEESGQHPRNIQGASPGRASEERPRSVSRPSI
eukprot:360299-Chlamydomonas_euryale.AAC.1